MTLPILFAVHSGEASSRDPLAAACALGGPGTFVSHGSALWLHGLSTRPWLIATVTSHRIVRQRELYGRRFWFVRGYAETVAEGVVPVALPSGSSVLASCPERTILDCLSAPERCGGVLEVAVALEMARGRMDMDMLVRFAGTASRAAASRLGYLMEILGIPGHERLAGMPGRSDALLEPLLAASGPRSRRWKLRLNVPEQEIIGEASS